MRRGAAAGWGVLTGAGWLRVALGVVCGVPGAACLGGAGACFFVPETMCDFINWF